MDCKQCQQQFTIHPEDKAFYQKFDVLEPELCYDCRAQRRLSFRNERFLYERECDKCKKHIISAFSKDKDYIIYCHDCWHKDDWSPLDYGQDYDPQKSFWQQFKELAHKVPMLSLVVETPSCTNSEYVNDASDLNNCYLVYDISYGEDCYYGESAVNLKNCIDFLNTYDSELCYETVYCDKAYNLFFSKYCNSCYDSYFLTDCVGCNNCFACCNLVNAKYCIWNKQYTENEYKIKIQEYKSKIKNYSELQKIKKQVEKFVLKFPKRATRGIKNEDCIGNNVNHSKNSYYCFDCRNLENSRYCSSMFMGGKDCMDVNMFGTETEACYNCVGVGLKSYNSICSHYTWRGTSDLTYCYFCYRNVKDLFACYCLTNAQYCILNKQYNKKEYFKLKQKIIERLKKEDIYGEYFPAELSPFAYNETQAQEYYPLTKERAKKLGYQWKEKDIKEYQPAHDDILACLDCGKNYKLIKQEIDFYNKNNLPTPIKCPDCRHYDRIKFRNPNKFYKRQCANCNQQVVSVYSLDRPEIIYCYKCYQKAVY